jgi:dihydrodipicolinate synthase/N-acetylneuraminate lyase
MAVHLRQLAPYAQGWLVPGSTGDGWEMSDEEVLVVLDHVLGIAASCDVRVLIGVLRTTVEAIVLQMERLSGWLCDRTGKPEPLDALQSANVCGFTVCPPAGADLSDLEIRDGLKEILASGLPVALYQLPQVTQNEISPATAELLAASYPNFYLLKDTSGLDRIALSGKNLEGVFLVRGAEGDYARWSKAGGGPYDGLLLSTANCFASQLCRMLEALDAGQPEKAFEQMAPVERVVTQAFQAVRDFGFGNPFTNANKAIDHFLAFGRQAQAKPGPRLHCGQTISDSILSAVSQSLRDNGLLPDVGYLTRD